MARGRAAREWPEKELEEFTKNNMASLWNAMSGSPAEIDLIGTQITCALGRIDMLFTTGINIFPVEFKAVKATEKDLGQVLRYVSMIEKVIDPYSRIQLDDNYLNIANKVFFKVQPVIVAPAFDKTLFLSDCVLVAAAKNDDGSFNLSKAPSPFQWAKVDLQNAALKTSLESFEKFIVGNAIGHLMMAGINS